MSPRTTIISGASGGLGKALALHYAKTGIHLFLTARNAERLNEVADECRAKGAEVTTHILDVNETDKVHEWIKAIAETSTLDLIIANAGVMNYNGPGRKLETAEDALSQIDTNLGGCIAMATAASPIMQKQGHGHIAFIASLAGLQPLSNLPGYSASKAGLIAYGEALHAFLSQDGITISTICPGYIETDMISENKGWKPMKLTADKAAAKIKNALDRKKVFYAFPWPMALSITFGRLVPFKWRKYATAAFDFQH